MINDWTVPFKSVHFTQSCRKVIPRIEKPSQRRLFGFIVLQIAFPDVALIELRNVSLHCIIFSEMSRLLVTLRTLCLASEVVKKLEKVTETLLRVKMDYPHLKIDIEETKQTGSQCNGQSQGHRHRSTR